MAPVPADPDQASNLTSGLTSVLACLIPVLAFLYICGVLWTLDFGNRRRAPLNKTPSLASHRYAPIAYAFIVLSSLVVIAIPSWILLQYSLYQNYPNAEARIAMRLVLFAACWTSVTAAIFTILFVHPTWSKHPISSIGTQSIWVILTWTFWLAGVAVLNRALPRLFDKNTCQRLIYCGHIRALFGKVESSVLRFGSVSHLYMKRPLSLTSLCSVVFTGGMVIAMWLAWRCARDVWYPSPIRSQTA
ncbi:hypothetical protein B0H19DRAFT_1287203 [Mycena capillaripes]|nr:hypothetical protein B0H19DRAFT_1287203 [Mycena capillaripes]